MLEEAAILCGKYYYQVRKMAVAVLNPANLQPASRNAVSITDYEVGVSCVRPTGKVPAISEGPTNFNVEYYRQSNFDQRLVQMILEI